MEYSKFQLSRPRLLNVKYNLNDNFNPPDSLTLEISSSTTVKKAKNKPLAIVILTLRVFDESKLSEVPFFIEIKMQGIFKWSDDLEEKTIKSLLQSNASAILLSYIRPLVTQLTTYSDFPPLILPLLDFTSNVEVNEEELGFELEDELDLN